VRRIPVIVTVLIVGLGAGTALPETAVAPLVAERRASMKAMANAAKIISGIFDGKVAYDAAAFKAAAETIRRRSGRAMVDAFPADSLDERSAAKARSSSRAKNSRRSLAISKALRRRCRKRRTMRPEALRKP
jgi:cytochrome c556